MNFTNLKSDVTAALEALRKKYDHLEFQLQVDGVAVADMPEKCYCYPVGSSYSKFSVDLYTPEELETKGVGCCISSRQFKEI